MGDAASTIALVQNSCCCPEGRGEVDFLNGETRLAVAVSPEVQVLEGIDDEFSRVKEQVNTFAKIAAEGAPCTYFAELENQLAPALYCLDPDGNHLLVLRGDRLEHTEVLCPILSIVEMYTFEESPKYFPSGLVGLVREEDTSALLMVVFQREAEAALSAECSSEGGAIIRFCLLLQSTEARNVFIESLSVLVVHAHTFRKWCTPSEADVRVADGCA